MASEQSPYKSSSEQQRFSRQLDRDLARSSGKLSQSVIRKLLTEDTKQWANAIYNQKLAQNNSTNASAQQSPPTAFATTQTSEELPTSAIGATTTGNDSSATANASSPTGGTGLPEGAMFKEFDVCENGNPTTYWFVVWNEEPFLEEE
jgi:hypothetical protein